MRAAAVLCGVALLALLAAAAAATTTTPTTDDAAASAVPGSVPAGRFAFVDTFQDDAAWRARWVRSTQAKFNGELDVAEAAELVGLSGDRALRVPTPFRHYGYAAPLAAVFETGDDGALVLQYEVRLTKSLECGGAYLKLITAADDFEPSQLSDSTPYTVMFGPDKCGTSSKVHFIFRHRNPLSGAWEEKHMTNPPPVPADKISHLYTLIVRPDNTFEVQIDLATVKSGSLLADFEPPVNPPREIPDPSDLKPADWVDEAKIPDPDATKPDDWDEEAPFEIVDPEDSKPAGWLDDAPLLVPDPQAAMPDDWDESEDGEWEPALVENPACAEVGCGTWKPRLIRNPAYKGKWSAPMIANPEYQGPWAPRNIPNPHYFEDAHPHRLAPIAAIAIEIWTITDGIMFDNIVLGSDEAAVKAFAQQTFAVRHAKETAMLEKEKAASSGTPVFERLRAEFWSMYRSRPWVLALVIALPLAAVFILAYMCCCRRSQRPAGHAPSAAAAAHKKDDDADAPKAPEASNDAAAAADAPKVASSDVKQRAKPAEAPAS